MFHLDREKQHGWQKMKRVLKVFEKYLVVFNYLKLFARIKKGPKTIPKKWQKLRELFVAEDQIPWNLAILHESPCPGQFGSQNENEGVKIVVH